MGSSHLLLSRIRQDLLNGFMQPLLYSTTQACVSYATTHLVVHLRREEELVGIMTSIRSIALPIPTSFEEEIITYASHKLLQC